MFSLWGCLLLIASPETQNIHKYKHAKSYDNVNNYFVCEKNTVFSLCIVIISHPLYDLYIVYILPISVLTFYLAVTVQLKVLFSQSFFRKLQPLHSSQSKSLQSNHSFHKTPGDYPSSQLSPAKNLSVVTVYLHIIVIVNLHNSERHSNYVTFTMFW